MIYVMIATLREKCPNTEFFLVRNFPHSDWIRRDMEYLETPYLGIFQAVWSRYNKTDMIMKTHKLLWNFLISNPKSGVFGMLCDLGPLVLLKETKVTC